MQVKGTLYLPGDKSISHRAIMLSCIADGIRCFALWIPEALSLGSLLGC